ncbi:MAG: p-hydroxycinnamoyl CoA hydratase/lyase [Rhodospirillaceae bacterium]|nr:p-hydroxycinnamoyl CoA hydratase/lyase [Rhodospirillaceae bacterium]
MAYKTLKLEIADSIALVTLNRPEKRNAMNPTMHVEMTDLLEKLRYEDKANVVVFTGAGPSFCAGMDLKEFFLETREKPKEYDRITRLAVEWRYRTLRYFPKVTIAMINGYCFGGAFSFIEGCDLAVAAEEATFGLSEINFKMFPGGSVSKALANLLRPRDALWYGLTGDPFQGKEAAAIGLINRAYPLAKLKDETMKVARGIAAKDPVALKSAKEAYRYSLEMSGDAALSYSSAKEAEVMLLQQDAWRKEGIADFVQGKYKPGLGGHEQAAGGARG